MFSESVEVMVVTNANLTARIPPLLCPFNNWTVSTRKLQITGQNSTSLEEDRKVTRSSSVSQANGTVLNVVVVVVVVIQKNSLGRPGQAIQGH